MARKSNPAGHFYYANGQKIDLEPADDLAVIEGKATRAPAASSTSVSRPLVDDLRLVSKSDVLPAAPSKPQYPVFRSQGSIVVVLPEVRVEETRAAYRAKLDSWLAEHADDVTVVSRDDDRVSLKAASGSGEDALAIANKLAEEVRPEMAQARFIRVTPSPNHGAVSK